MSLFYGLSSRFPKFCKALRTVVCSRAYKDGISGNLRTPRDPNDQSVDEAREIFQDTVETKFQKDRRYMMIHAILGV